MDRQRHTAARRWSSFCGLLCLVLAAPALQAREVAASGTGVIGVDTAQLDPAHWVALQPEPDAIVLDRDAITAQNRRLLAEDDSTRDIATLPASLAAAQVRGWIQALSRRPNRTLYDAQGRPVDAATVDGWIDALDLAAVPASQPTRYGLVVQRADLRTFPTRSRVFSRVGDTDIDRFQENAFFPGTPVALVHESADGQWWFVVGDLYAAWIEKRFVAEGDKARVFGYARPTGPSLVVTGATARTTTTPEEPRVSGLQLDMGIRLPWRRDWPGARPVNGQAAYTGYVVDLPVRETDGGLAIVPALLPRTADVAPDYLPLTRANLLRQSFKFLGERYGWGHSYGTRDCSGFVSEVYRSMGVVLPRNTSDQGVSPVLNRVALGDAATAAQRARAVDSLQVGDLVYIPGHVMMVIGFERGMPYVIHDTNGGSWLGPDGALVQGRLNGVSVTPLTPLRLGRERSYVDGITNIQRIRPTPSAQAAP